MIDIHALSGAYAVDALDEQEREEFERHLARCPACRDEVDSLREASGLLAETQMLEPPAALRGRVLAGIETVRPLPPVVREVTQLSTRRTRRWFPGVAAAAAVVAILGVGGVVWHPWTDDPGTSDSPRISATERILGAPDAESWTEDLPDGATATFTRSKTYNQAVVQTTGLPDLPDDQVYELWLQHDKTGLLPAGLMDADDGTLLLEGDAASATGAGITVEPAGGSNVPTSDPITFVEFENA